jgi:DNA-binding response OmpR family regulator
MTRTIDTHIAEPRRALNDDPAAPCFIETVTGQGYRLVGQGDVVP